MNFDAIFLALLSSGWLIALIQGIFGIRKNKAEVMNNNIKTAIELENVAMSRYDNIIKAFNADEKLILSLHKELNICRYNINLLSDTLIKHNIELPELKGCD